MSNVTNVSYMFYNSKAKIKLGNTLTFTDKCTDYSNFMKNSDTDVENLIIYSNGLPSLSSAFEGTKIKTVKIINTNPDAVPRKDNNNNYYIGEEKIFESCS